MLGAPKILVVEDDENLSYLLRENLIENNFEVSVSNSAENALDKLDKEMFHLCLLDVLLPGMDGISLAKKLKSTQSDMPIVFLTSRNLKSDQEIGYIAGCDDYITKPFDTDILVMKINAILRRYSKGEDTPERHVRLKDMELDLSTRILKLADQEMKLSQTEAGLIHLFITNVNQPLSRENIMKKVWGKSDYFTSKSLDVYMVKVRKIITNSTNLKLETIHSYGYLLADSAEKNN